MNSFADLKCLVANYSPDILLQESRLTTDKFFALKNYRVFRLDCNSRGGGLLTLVSSRLSRLSFFKTAFTSLELMSPSGEVLAVDLVLPGSPPISLVCVYFPVGFRRVDKMDSFISL